MFLAESFDAIPRLIAEDAESSNEIHASEDRDDPGSQPEIHSHHLPWGGRVVGAVHGVEGAGDHQHREGVELEHADGLRAPPDDVEPVARAPCSLLYDR